MSYKTSNAEGPVDFINTYDLEPMAQQVIPKAAFGYIASGAEDTFTLRENTRVKDNWHTFINCFSNFLK